MRILMSFSIVVLSEASAFVYNKLTFLLTSFVVDWTVRWGNGYTTTLPLEVFTQRNFIADFVLLKLNFILKIAFEPPFRGTSG